MRTGHIFRSLLGLFTLIVLLTAVFSIPAIAEDTHSFRAKQRVEFSRLNGGQYLIDVMINEKGPFKFMIDSAATRSCLFEKTAAELGITEFTGLEKNVNGLTGSGSTLR